MREEGEEGSVEAETVYFEALGGEGEEGTWRAALERADLLVEVDEPRPGRVRILACIGVDGELLTRVRALSGSKRHRVLVVLFRPAPTREVFTLLKAGADDVLSAGEAWGEEVRARVERWGEVDDVVESEEVRTQRVGQSPAWKLILREIVEVGGFSEAPILLLGETGTGKELLAQLIHLVDARSGKKPLAVLDCTNLSPELAGSELFGHEKGAFTGASGQRDGVFFQAHGGTLFLDEVGELPPPLQAQFLRVLQEGKYKRVGGNQWYDSRFRLVCATHQDLQKAVKQGTFRADLYHRIAGAVCRVPPLRERREDILPLAHHFIARAREENKGCGFSPDVEAWLLNRSYPGNVRDLQHMVSRMAWQHAGSGPITAGCIPRDELPLGEEEGLSWEDSELNRAVRGAVVQRLGLKELQRLVSDLAVEAAFDLEEGNLARAAKLLQVTDRALQMRRAGPKIEAA